MSVCCQVEVSATSRSLVQRSAIDWCVVCDLETSIMRRPWPTAGAVAPKTNKIWFIWNDGSKFVHAVQKFAPINVLEMEQSYNGPDVIVMC